MTKSILFGASGIAVAFAMLAFGYAAGDLTPARAQEMPQTAQAGAPLDKAAIEQIVRDYLLANPEILEEMQASLDEKRKEEQRVAQIETIQSNKDEIFNASYDGVVGNPKLQLEDGMHPNGEGVRVMAEGIAPLVAETLRQNTGG